MRTEELTKCYEPLQKLRVRLWPCKTGLKTGLGYKRPHRYTCVILSLTAEVLTSTPEI